MPEFDKTYTYQILSKNYKHDLSGPTSTNMALLRPNPNNLSQLEPGPNFFN